MSTLDRIALDVDAAAQVLTRGVPDAFPGAVAVVLQGDSVVLHTAVGRRTVTPAESGAGRAGNVPGTRYDLASLTKPMAAWPVLMHAIAQGRIDWDTPVAPVLKPTADWEGVTVAQLAGHASGLAAWRALDPAAPREDVLASVLQSPPGERAVYSDLGYLALGWTLEAVLGAPLDALLDRVRERFALGETRFAPLSDLALVAPTEAGVPLGVVHDANARSFGGACGHAGLFGTALDVARFGRRVLELSRGTDRLAALIRYSITTGAARQPTTWRLGFDTVTPGGSSAGRFFGPRAFGHLGYTGTSLWLEPDRDLVVVLLSNRVHPVDEPDPEIRRLRPAFHDALGP